MISEMQDLGFPLHVADFGGVGQTYVLVHGLGGSHRNWVSFAPLLARHGRVLAVDLPGFGRTPPLPGRVNLDNAVLALDRFLQGAGMSPAVLVGNSMGGAVSILEASRRPERVSGVVLLDPALPAAVGAKVDPAVAMRFLPRILPWIAERSYRARRLRLGPEAQVRELFDLALAEPGKVPREVFELQVDMTRERASFEWTDRSMVEAARSVIWALARRREYEAAMRAVRAPVLLVHGDRDRLVPVAAARQAAAMCPSWRLEIFEGVGHVPQLEAPERLLELVLDWRKP